MAPAQPRHEANHLGNGGVVTTEQSGLMDDAPTTSGPLPLADENRVERYEIVAPDGRVVEVTHDLDSGELEYVWTTRTARPSP